MPQQTVTRPAAEIAEMGIRCRLLMPIMEGNTLEDEDISSFLAGRLSSDGEESDPADGKRLS